MSNIARCDGPDCVVQVEVVGSWDESDDWFVLRRGDDLTLTFHADECLAGWVTKNLDLAHASV